MTVLTFFSMNGVLEFVDASDVTVMANTEHFMATDVEWDPTGRYVVSAVSWWGHKVSNNLSSMLQIRLIIILPSEGRLCQCFQLYILLYWQSYIFFL